MARTAFALAAFAGLSAVACFVAPVAPRTPAVSPASGTTSTESACGPEGASASWSPLALGVGLGLLVAVLGVRPVLAADLENGESVFAGNCAACHAGGNNSVVPEKKIKKEALEQYLTGGFSVQSIITQVTNGKGSMPAFGERLGPDDIEDVANWVFNQADKW
eukprot:CAMPEP_0171091366 /NCGR_PEP_ID=MMETSP0766_2-20121228/32876_1 /TAXON_ID=439317 /ORGANISM="Gambierdiscus australes, Strain CAWD 149" /LENGTH=162 /DNA_ID=CAMNT_0011549467 /DNA_START=48 /DNA_END=536 /DNA_ORIENTATION=+